MQFIKKNFEWLLILLCAIGLLLTNGEVTGGPILTMMAFLAVAFYYLLSAVLVLTDKRVERPVRLIFIVGLYVISVGVVGTLFRVLFWQGADIMLIIALSSGVAVLAVVVLFNRFTKGATRYSIKEQLSRLTIRLVPFLFVFAAAHIVPTPIMFDLFAEHRDDSRYKELFLRSLEYPDNHALQDSLKLYRQKHFNNDDQTSPANNR